MRKIHILSLLYILFIIVAITIANTGNGKMVYFLLKEIPYSDKIGHFILMGGLAMMVNLSLGYRSFKSLPIGAVLVISFVLLEELTQINNVYRTFDLLDLSADFIGIVFFTWVGKRYFYTDASLRSSNV